MILVADSGSTKTEWCLINTETGITETCLTSGTNPLYQDEESIYHILRQEFTLRFSAPDRIFFYGAGCINEGVKDIVRNSLTRFFSCLSITVHSDLMAAARSLCQNREGIACILGTGSNSCYYNGHDIERHVSPLGYILGDEGSGAVIGRKFMADLLKKQLPEAVAERFYEHYQLTSDQVIENVYKAPFPNRFLAQFTRFIHENLAEPSLKELVKTSFREFFERNIRQYPEAQRLPVHFTGSVAWYFSDLLKESARESGFETGTITLAPIKGLVDYHLKI